MCTCVCVSVRACHGGYIEMFNFLAGTSEYSTVSVFQSYCSSLLSVLALGPAVILRVYFCLDLGPETDRLQHV